MDITFMQLYVLFAMLTTLAFIYLFFHYFFTNNKNTTVLNLTFEEIDHLASSIQAVLEHTEVKEQITKQQPNHNLQTHQQTTQTLLKSNGSNIRICKKYSTKTLKYLPHSADGLIHMKNLNRTFTKEAGKDQQIGKPKKKKSVINYVKKYDFHKTSLVTIFEGVEY